MYLYKSPPKGYLKPPLEFQGLCDVVKMFKSDISTILSSFVKIYFHPIKMAKHLMHLPKEIRGGEPRRALLFFNGWRKNWR